MVRMLLTESTTSNVRAVRRTPGQYLTRFSDSCCRPRSAGITHAQTVDRTFPQKVKQSSSSERVLRYPDGRVRYIRYPLITTEGEAQADQLDVTRSYEEDWDPDRWDEFDWAWDVSSLWEAGSNHNASVSTPTPRPTQEATTLPKVTLMCSPGCAKQIQGVYFFGPLCRQGTHSTVLQTCYEL